MFTERRTTDTYYIHTDTAHVDQVNEGLANARPNYTPIKFTYGKLIPAA